jgi:hypothetical protein
MTTWDSSQEFKNGSIMSNKEQYHINTMKDKKHDHFTLKKFNTHS